MHTHSVSQNPLFIELSERIHSSPLGSTGFTPSNVANALARLEPNKLLPSIGVSPDPYYVLGNPYHVSVGSIGCRPVLRTISLAIADSGIVKIERFSVIGDESPNKARKDIVEKDVSRRDFLRFLAANKITTPEDIERILNEGDFLCLKTVAEKFNIDLRLQREEAKKINIEKNELLDLSNSDFDSYMRKLYEMAGGKENLVGMFLALKDHPDNILQLRALKTLNSPTSETMLKIDLDPNSRVFFRIEHVRYCPVSEKYELEVGGGIRNALAGRGHRITFEKTGDTFQIDSFGNTWIS